ncbi:hypothetical protein [uncultured Winogradskyella sp.]|uniref:hypothetical protein n=1 Tax=uncultured Winogradskyella sp. TaxID=395353 RepID=UPI00262C2DA0|nr:hypothetical protein [uncultured Winogradskyella sp.]
MSRFNYRLIMFIAVSFFSNSLMSQDEEPKNTAKKISDSSFVALSLNYISDAIFMGRRDSISAPYLYSTLMYHYKSGFYASGAVSYLTRANEGRVDLFLLTGGFDFTIKKLNGDLSFTTYFFNEDSYNVISEVSTDFTALLEYDFNLINLGLSASSYFSNDSNSDFFLSSEVSHDFITNDNKFQFSPTIGMSFGSQNFYEQYYINNRFGNGRGQGQGSSNTLQSTMVELTESERFNLMAIEMSLPIWYIHKSFGAVIVPSYVIPQNGATLSFNDELVEEDLDNTFYFIVGITYMF